MSFITGANIGPGEITQDAINSGETVKAPSQDSVFQALADKIDLTEKAANNGVATLDAGGKIPVAQLPNSIMEYQGNWNATTNSPALADGTGSAGDVYRVSVAGSQDLGSGSISFDVGDYVIYSGSVWQKSDTTDAVASVNSQTGVVVLDSDDISEGATNLYFTAARAKTAAVADTITNGITDVAPSQNAVFDALALKEDAGANWSLLGNAGTVNGTNFLGTTDAVDLSVIANNVEQIRFLVIGGWYSDLIHIPVDATTMIQYGLYKHVNPTSDTTTSNEIGLKNTLVYDEANAGHDHAGSISALTNRVEHLGEGHIGYMSLMEGSAYFGHADGHTDMFKGNNLDVGIATGHQLDQFYGVNSYITSEGDLQTLRAFDSNLLLNGGSVDNVTGDNTNINVNNATAIAFNTISRQDYIGAGGTSTLNGVYSTSNSVNIFDDATVANIFGTNSFIQVQDTSEVTNQIYGMNNGLEVSDTGVVAGITGTNTNIQLRNDANVLNVTGINAGVGTHEDVITSSITGLNVNNSYEDNSDLGNVTNGFIGGNMSDAATADNFSGLNVDIGMSGTSSTTNLTPFRVFANIQDTATVTNNVTVAEIGISSTPALAGVNGLTINMSSANVTDPFARVALNINNGAISANNGITIPGSTMFYQSNYIGGGEVVALGDPVSAYGFGTNLAHSLEFHDDWTPDFTGLRLGYVSVGFVGAVAGDAGKTLDTWNGALAGFGNPSGAGTIDQAIMFRAAGGLPQGGSIAVNNMYGFFVNSTIGLISTNTWGFYDDSGGAENYLGKLAIGTASKTVASGIALDVDGKIQTDDAIVLQDPGAGTNKITITSPTLSGDYTLTLPVDAGTSGYVLQTNGSGVTSWQPASGAGTFEVEYRTITGGEETAKQLTLAATPLTPAKVLVDYISGCAQSYSVDFTVSGATLDWNGLGLDGVLTAGDELRIVYFS
jgi:hypothetical protein